MSSSLTSTRASAASSTSSGRARRGRRERDSSPTPPAAEPSRVSSIEGRSFTRTPIHTNSVMGLHVIPFSTPSSIHDCSKQRKSIHYRPFRSSTNPTPSLKTTPTPCFQNANTLPA
ncbi:hypothetical protein AVEN_132067-1 [Araneus ventricosus]|uniref:Uncharacterized protein n=1 Tax=Araneus ventricosus TaxID=182803 RepID=A0A4Y2MSF5_ARAVE|nr:hypothetical protein AVEN_132067-1 [Araneus ventricosus]